MISLALFFLGLAIVAIGALLFAALLDEQLDQRHPGYSRGWDRIFGESDPQPSHVRAIAPMPCNGCGSRGWHLEGCSRLDRLDAPRWGS